MEKTKTKKTPVIRDLRKIKTLLFLSMRGQTDKRAATAREIAIATGGSADSLYVLLGRWTAWGLVHWRGTEPFSYMIAPEGQRYLSKISNWFFSGYYSKKRKKRMPGYRGKVEDLKREIAIASRALFWWRYYPNHWDRDREGHKGFVYYIQAPFKTAQDLVKVESSYGRAISTNVKGCQLVVKFDSALEAYQYLPEWGFQQKNRRELGQAIVDAKIGMVWAKDA